MYFRVYSDHRTGILVCIHLYQQRGYHLQLFVTSHLPEITTLAVLLPMLQCCPFAARKITRLPHITCFDCLNWYNLYCLKEI